MKEDAKLQLKQEENKRPSRKDLLAFMKGKAEKLSEEDLKDNILGLFDDILKRAEFTDPIKQGKIARLRARIEIELRDF